jgi:tetratricopeptide (TPR) repeat protein
MPSLHELYDDANQLKEEGRYDEAIAKLQDIVAQDATYALAHAALAVVFGKVGKHEDAIHHAKMVCELEPQDPFSFTALSVTYQRAFAGTSQTDYIQLAEQAMAQSQMMQGP